MLDKPQHAYTPDLPDEPPFALFTEKEAVDSLTIAAESDQLIPTTQINLEVGCNTSSEDFLANVRINGARDDVPWLGVAPIHEEQAVLVGGGSSVDVTMFEIAERKAGGQPLFALNGAAKYLADRHITVDYQVVIDGRPETIKFLQGLPAKRYLLSSGCHPSLFDFLVEHKADVQMFHFAHEGLSEALPKGRHIVMVGGHYTVGLVAMSVVTAMGFRILHLYGYDSSDSDDGRGHAYPQGETVAESERLQIVCAGRKFTCSHAMFKQAEVFPTFATMMADFGCTIAVHGDGLLPTVAREMANNNRYDGPENGACYNMEEAPACFDFIKWLVTAEMDRRRRGAPAPLLVGFADGSDNGFRAGDVHTVAEKHQMMEHVIRPALRLFGAVEDESAKRSRQYHYWYRPITDAYRNGEAIPQCKPPTESVLDATGFLFNHGMRPHEPLVITLRETRYLTQRNSDVGVWVEFARRRRAEGYKIVFVRDTYKADEPLEDFVTYPKAAKHLWTRTAIYSLAKCNLMVANGPVELIEFGGWPMIQFKKPHVDALLPVSLGSSWWQRFAGITPPEQFPWFNKSQMFVWQRDTIDNLEAAWLRWLAATTET